ncbi:MAG: hypothetical protein IKR25_12850 [Muribaculaceae bacterium]|nr:hypothetical protein [Muribaculaceae bacterium]
MKERKVMLKRGNDRYIDQSVDNLNTQSDLYQIGEIVSRVIVAVGEGREDPELAAEMMKRCVITSSVDGMYESERLIAFVAEGYLHYGGDFLKYAVEVIYPDFYFWRTVFFCLWNEYEVNCGDDFFVQLMVAYDRLLDYEWFEALNKTPLDDVSYDYGLALLRLLERLYSEMEYGYEKCQVLVLAANVCACCGITEVSDELRLAMCDSFDVAMLFYDPNDEDDGN